MKFIKNIKRFLSVNWFLTIYVNLYYFDFFKAIHFPLLMGYGTKIGSLGNRGSIEIKSKFGQFCFGLKGAPFCMGDSGNYFHVGKEGRILVKGTCRMAKGVRLKVFEKGLLQIGSGFTSNANFIISCMNSVEIGNDCLVGWNVTIMDNDGGHSIIDCESNLITNTPKTVTIGNHCWLASQASVLKGSSIPNNCTIGFGSIIAGKKYVEDGCIIAGAPSKILLKKHVWIH